MTPQRRTLITTATLIAATVVAVIAALAQGTLASLPGIAGLLTTVTIAPGLMYAVLTGITPSKAAFTVFILGWAVIALASVIGMSVESYTQAQMVYSSAEHGREPTASESGDFGWYSYEPLHAHLCVGGQHAVQYPDYASGSSNPLTWFLPYSADSTSTILGWLVGVTAAITYFRTQEQKPHPGSEKD